MDCQRLQELFIVAYPEIQDAAFAGHPQLLCFDLERIVAKVAAQLPTYAGLLEQEPFNTWAVQMVKAEVRKVAFIEAVLRDHRRVILKAINDCLRGMPLDLSVEPEDILEEVLAYVLEHVEEFSEQGTAKLSTRLYSLGKRHAWLYHGAYRKRNETSVARRLRSTWHLGVETLSDAELAELRTMEEKAA